MKHALRCAGNGVGAEGAARLSEVLKENNTLTSLDLGCELDDGEHGGAGGGSTGRGQGVGEARRGLGAGRARGSEWGRAAGVGGRGG